MNLKYYCVPCNLESQVLGKSAKLVLEVLELGNLIVLC